MAYFQNILMEAEVRVQHIPNNTPGVAFADALPSRRYFLSKFTANEFLVAIFFEQMTIHVLKGATNSLFQRARLSPQAQDASFVLPLY